VDFLVKGDKKTFIFLLKIEPLGRYFRIKNYIFNSGNAVLGEAFTHTPPTLKKWMEKVVKKPNAILPNVTKTFGQTTFGLW